MPGFIVILVATLTIQLHMSASSPSKATTSPGTNVWHLIHNGKIWVSDEGLQLDRKKAVEYCESFSQGLWEGRLLEMPTNGMYNNVEKILNRIGIAEGEKFRIGGTLKDEWYMWINNRSDINQTLYDEKGCQGYDSVYAFLSSSGKMKLCANFSTTDMRFICYRSSPGARLVEVDATTKLPFTKAAFVDVHWEEYGRAYGNIWVSSPEERATLKEAGQFCCKLVNSNYDYWAHHELLDVVNTTVYNNVSEIMKKEIEALEEPAIDSEKMFWLGSTMYPEEDEYRWMVSGSWIEKKWFSKGRSCKLNAQHGGFVAGIMEQNKLRLCKVYKERKLRFMCMLDDLVHPMHTELKIMDRFITNCLR